MHGILLAAAPVTVAVLIAAAAFIAALRITQAIGWRVLQHLQRVPD